MELLKFINENKDWEDIIQKEPYYIKVVKDTCGGHNYILLKYDQIHSDFSQPLVRECRGIILDADTYKIVCWPFYKFFNYGEPNAAAIDWSTARVQEKLDGCFEKNSRVMLADGTCKKIGTIVNQRLTCEVMSYNFVTKKCEPKKVIGWKRSNSCRDEWVSLNLGGVSSSLNGRVSCHNIMTVTKNHMIYIYNDNDEIIEKCADDINIGDRIIYPTERLSAEEEQILIGSLLGDGNLSGNPNSEKKYLRISHCAKQEAYLDWKINKLQSFKWIKNRKIVNNGYKIGSTQYVGDTTNDNALTYYYNITYSSSKRFYTELLDKLDWLGFAVWYMDDGYLNKSAKNNSITLSTEAFSYADHLLIQSHFEALGYKCYIVTEGKYYRINFSTESSEEIWKKIRNMIPECMQYKLPERHKGFYTDFGIRHSRSIGILCRQVKGKSYDILPTSFCGGQYFQKYDIEVEGNHNYFCDGILVHNSIMKLWNHEGKWLLSTNGTINAFKAEFSMNDLESLVYPYPGKTFGSLFTYAINYKDLDIDNLDTRFTYMFELVSPYTKIVVSYPEIIINHIGTRNNETGEEVVMDIGIKKPKEYPITTLDDCVNAAKALTPNEEGYVVVDANWNRVKVKNPVYFQMHHLVNNHAINMETVVDMLRENEQDEFLNYFPEYKEIFSEVRMKLKYYKKDLEKNWEILKEYKEQTRKEFALKVMEIDKLNSSFYFRKLDNDKFTVDEYVSKMPADNLKGRIGY